jgi:hypothetical protein
LWLNNDYPIYIAAVRYMESHPKAIQPYVQFIRDYGLDKQRTPDNIAWLSTRLDYEELNAMMRELVA